MLTKDQLDLKMMKALTEVDGISGDEVEAVQLMKEYAKPYCDEFDYDNLGSLICHRKGKGPKIMLAGHIDEIGFIVNKIEDNGIIRITPVGGWNTLVMPAHMVSIKTRKNQKYRAIIGTSFNRPVGTKTMLEMKEMYVDLGYRTKQEVLDLGINLGDSVTPIAEFEVMANPDVLCSKAWDDRVGALIGIDVLKQLGKDEIDADLYVVGTAQEEVGIRGAQTAGYKVKPDISIAIDVCGCDDIPGGNNVQKLDGGVVINFSDASHLGHRGLIEYMENVCKDLNIEVGYVTGMMGGTDTGAIHKLYDGIIAITISIPTLYIHSHRSFIHRNRYVAIVNAITEFVRRINNADLEKIRAYNR